MIVSRSTVPNLNEKAVQSACPVLSRLFRFGEPNVILAFSASSCEAAHVLNKAPSKVLSSNTLGI